MLSSSNLDAPTCWVLLARLIPRIIPWPIAQILIAGCCCYVVSDKLYIGVVTTRNLTGMPPQGTSTTMSTAVHGIWLQFGSRRRYSSGTILGGDYHGSRGVNEIVIKARLPLILAYPIPPRWGVNNGYILGMAGQFDHALVVEGILNQLKLLPGDPVLLPANHTAPGSCPSAHSAHHSPGWPGCPRKGSRPWLPWPHR